MRSIIIWSPVLFRQLWRAQVSAFLATTADFFTLVTGVEVFGIPYQIATGLGAGVGAVTNFILGRNWTFEVKTEAAHRQFSRYVIVAVCSFALNWVGVIFFTEVFHSRYWISKVVTACVVWFFNFTMQRTYVFRMDIQYQRRS